MENRQSIDFDRAAFEREVLSKSPLYPQNFDDLLGGVGPDTKRLAWKIMTMPKPCQCQLWMVFSRLKMVFPEARVTA